MPADGTVTALAPAKISAPSRVIGSLEKRLFQIREFWSIRQKVQNGQFLRSLAQIATHLMTISLLIRSRAGVFFPTRVFYPPFHDLALGKALLGGSIPTNICSHIYWLVFLYLGLRDLYLGPILE